MSLGVEPERAWLVDVNGTRLRVWEWGDAAAPPVVFVHGAYDHGRMFDDLAPRVATLGFRCVAVDLRGHGDSGRLASGNVWLAMNIDLGLLARHLGAPVGVVGHSFGGGQALCAAGMFPEWVRWVVNIDGLGPPPEALVVADVAEACTRGLEAAERVWTSPPREYESLEEMARRRQKVNVRLSDAWAMHLVRHGARRGPAGGWIWKFDPMFSVGVPGAFDRDLLLAEYQLVRCPVLALTGSEHDTWSDLGDDEIAARVGAIAHARHAVVDGAGHYVHLEQPDAVVDHIRRFVAEVGA